MRRRLIPIAVAAAVVALLAGCVSGGDDSSEPDPNDPNTLRIVAGSEVKDMVPILKGAQSAIGVKVSLTYEGTLDGTELVASGGAKGKFDATWFPNNRYLSLLPGAASATSTSVKIMSSPVVFGLKPAVAESLGWDTTPPTWAQLAQAAADGKFTYGMTNPSASNSGFSALVAVATAFSGTGSALTDADIDTVTPQLKTFFSGQKLTAGSSGWLADKFTQDPDLVDGIINYQSVLEGLNTSKHPLDIIVPSDGVVTSDYPLTLLTSADAHKKALFDKLTTWLTTTAVQKRIFTETHRRPGIPGVQTGQPQPVTFETPFPNTLDVANTLIATYLDAASPPSQTLFVLDTSGSMDGDRIADLRKALKNLAGADTSTIGSFAQFRNRERVTLLPFNTAVASPITVDVPEADKSAALQQISDEADGLYANGGTAIYDALRTAYGLALKQQAQRPDTFVSIVLMTDGENTDGSSAQDFEKYYARLGSKAKPIPTFVVLFGDGDRQALTHLSTLTGGQVFDALNGDLTGAFQEIRGYQ